MPVLSEIIAVIEELAPPVLAEDWDNCGLQIGETGGEVHKLLFALDPLPEVIEEAARSGASLVVTHHPLFFDPVKSLDLSFGLGATVKAAALRGVSVYSAHTSLDSVRGGISDALASVLKLKGVHPILDKGVLHKGAGLGRVGTLPKPMNAGDVAAVMKKALGSGQSRLIGDPKKAVRKVAVCGGSGAELIDDVLRLRAELFVTGDVKYHAALKAREHGLALLDVGHFESEIYALPLFAANLRRALKKKGMAVAVELSCVQTAPWRIV